jgi:putative Mg2+ transporter-C (MgtC) family protein
MPTLSIAELVLRVLLATGLGAVIGLEREISDQPAGFRTHILVSLGAALFTLTGAYGLADFAGGDGVRVNLDPTRVAAQVVTGIGFLGAGAIIQRGVNIRGLTTAASLWVTAAVGTAAGLGYDAGAVAVTVAALLALVGLKWLERAMLSRVKRGQVRVVIDSEQRLQIGDLLDVIQASGGRLDQMKVHGDPSHGWTLVATVWLPDDASRDALRARALEIEGVRDVSLNP